MNVVYCLIPFFIFALLNCGVVYLSKKSFGITLSVTLIGSVMVTYFGQLIFHTFAVGTWLCAGLAVGALGLLIWKHRDKEFLSLCFSEGFWVFTVLFLFFLVLDSQRCFSAWDEFSHWGKMVREMLRIDRFYSEPQSNLLVHKDYPPFAPLFEMLWCKLSLGYSEARVTLALHVLEFSLVVPLAVELLKSKLCENKVQRWVNRLAVVVIFVIATLMFNWYDFNSIYTDLLMPLYYVMLVLVISSQELRQSTYGFVMILIGQFGLMLTKQMGIAYVMLAWLLYTFLEWISRVGSSVRGRMIRSLSVLACPLVSYVIWNRYIAGLDIDGQFSMGKLSLGAVYHILKGEGSDLQHSTYLNYVKALYSTNIGTGTIKLSFVSAALLALVLLFVMGYFFRSVTAKGEIAGYAIAFVVGSLGYAFTMFILYMFCFSDSEMQQLASFQRYLSSYVVGQYLLLLILFLRLWDRQGKPVYSTPVLCGILGFVFVLLGSDQFVRLMPQRYYEEPYEEYRIRAEKIQNVVPEDSNVFLISSDNCMKMYFINQYLEGIKMDDRYLYSNVADCSATDVTYWNEAMACMDEDEYLYVYNVTDNVNLMLGGYTADGVLKEDTTYKVTADNGTRVLEEVR